MSMKTTNVSKLRGSEASRVFHELKAGIQEPIAVLSSSKIIGYLVSSQLWDQVEAEMKRLRKRNRELFWDGVEDAEMQESMPVDLDELLAEVGLTRDHAH
jgi:hypothetical protein